MPRLTRQIQAAVRKAQQNASPLEKIVKQANNELYRQLGIPNVIKLGQSTSGGPSKDRGYAGQAATPGWSGLGVLGQALSKVAWQGGILEVTSPGPQGRDVARQLAAWRASDSRVLWLQLEPGAAAGAAAAMPGAGVGAAAGASGAAQQAACALAHLDSAGSEGPSLTVQRWPVCSSADSRAALQHLVRAVRSQRFALVVLDCVPALAPPLPAAGAAARARAPGAGWQAAAAAGPRGRVQDAGAAGVARAAVAAGQGIQATAAAVRQAAAGKPTPGAAAAAPAIAGAGLHSGPAPGRTDGTGAAVAAESNGRVPAGPAAATTAGPGDSLGTLALHQSPQAYTPPNYRFLYTELPQLMEQTLAALAISCGPELPTTTLLLNSYNRTTQQQGWMGGGAAAPAATDSSGLADRSRWARRAIARHVSGTLHLLPAGRPSAGPAATAAAAQGVGARHSAPAAGPKAAHATGAGGEAAGCDAGAAAGPLPPQSLSQLHVEVTRGLASGDDSDVLFSGWLGSPPTS
ncbi:hypothetical protein HYH02_010388 [Chlamydomonas schloesseri]|uniref:Uncharacterized protein n=1 Tax=Chlamydomonas schloesseri TaxID=2026947 RepID=A0A835TMN5_9CHLO|nr:hypothetical protein HYH02_010388 [Chlamydomonas schloesseri]|eukprot:KAG2440510.1 hypothetical protein HYH02_010388 [Chlamydomonas schloesseri]